MTVKPAPPPDLEIEDAPLVPVTGVKKDATGEAPKPVDTVEKYVLNGYSVGAVLYNQSYNAKVVGYFDASPASISSSTADLQNIGVIGRYSVIPVGSLGTDFGLSMSSSVNHGSVGYSQVMTTRFEMNLGWGFVTAKNLNYYVLGGFGYENLTGKELTQVVASGGGLIQGGAGFVYSKTLNFEGLLGIGRHGISNDFYNRVTAAGLAGGATTVNFEVNNSYVTSYIISGRVIYKF